MASLKIVSLCDITHRCMSDMLVDVYLNKSLLFSSTVVTTCVSSLSKLIPNWVV